MDTSVSVAFTHSPRVQHKAIVAEDAETFCLRSPAHSDHQVLGLCLRGLQIRHVAGQTVNDLGVLVTRAEPNGLNFEDHGKGSTALSFTEAYTMRPEGCDGPCLDGRAVETAIVEAVAGARDLVAHGIMQNEGASPYFATGCVLRPEDRQPGLAC